MTTASAAFVLKRYGEISNLKVFDVRRDIPFDVQKLCPADGEELKTICTLVGDSGRQRIRIGCCDGCGYAGYIDRPTREWINNYYLDTWDDGQVKSVKMEEDIRKRRDDAKQNGLKGEREVLDMVRTLELDKRRPVLEIGCGYGKTLKQLHDMGFADSSGLENSRYRAHIASAVHDLTVHAGPFEDKKLQQEFKKKAPYSLIFSYHVLEHVYDPDEIIRLSAALQSEGDVMMISVPNTVGEFSMSVLLYFPHLHSWSIEAFRRLLATNGYALTDASFSNDRYINIIARKGAGGGIAASSGGYFQKAIAKFSKGLGMDSVHSAVKRRLWWFRKHDIGGQLPVWSMTPAESIRWKFLKKKLRKEHELSDVICSAFIGVAPDRIIDPRESPLEIQFEGTIQMLYK